jgi:hypothetical protein
VKEKLNELGLVEIKSVAIGDLLLAKNELPPSSGMPLTLDDLTLELIQTCFNEIVNNATDEAIKDCATRYFAWDHGLQNRNGRLYRDFTQCLQMFNKMSGVFIPQ